MIAQFAVLRTQNDKEQPSGIDADKEDKPNIVIKSEFKSSGSIEFAPYFDPDKFGDEKKNVENGYTDDFNQTFATTPYDYGYYDSKIDTPTTVTQFETPRSIRQNVQSRTKTLVSDELDQLRSGLANKEYRFPVSLLPVNLRMLKINHPSTETPSKESSHETVSKKPQVFLYDGVQGANGSFYDVFMLAAICLGVALTLFGVMFGLYKFSITVKAPRRMDYPAYGVTGPTCDASTDTNLAKSAQMYHYQHQKQQMISMEKIGMDTRSVSDHESEEEGDYTVYECPGFATTGNMEVQNPIFDEGATQLRTTKVVIEPKV
ncbi:unnamed protein product [Parnassius mnemosyne]|uniref:Neural proliferation differentiation and control protein 1 n=1 Tax=Parnassius mnemosyne TaxID=213953 RepID=A0AAV1L1H2_9NEOP